MKAVIICNGAIEDYSFYTGYFENARLIICVDGGAGHARRFGIVPDIIIGDLDSILKEDMDYYSSIGVDILKFPVEKDMTDTELAVDHAIEKGYECMVIIGGIGQRLDHTMSNVYILKKILDKGAEGLLVNEYNEIRMTGDKLSLKREDNTKISLLPITPSVEGVTTKGLYYPLKNATIRQGSTRGISNEFISDTAQVSITGGLLLVIKSRDL